MRHTNPSGYVYYDDEAELCQELENLFFPTFFDNGWKPQLSLTKEVSPSENSFKRVDYYGTCNKKSTWIEVKNWWVMQKDIRQIYEYSRVLTQPYDFYVICGGIEKPRRLFLECLGMKIILTKNIEKLSPMELVYWM